MLRVLAVWGNKRLASMPDVPSMKELGYDATFYIWSGVFAPARTPTPIIEKLPAAACQTVNDPEFKQAMAKVETPIAYLAYPSRHRQLRTRPLAESMGSIEPVV